MNNNMPEAKKYNQKRLYGFPLFSPKQSKGYLLSCQSIRVADVWPFLNYTIRISKDKATKRLFHKDQQTYLLDLLEQAEYFYKTAQTAPIKSQPLLYYYSFMNLVKIVINLDHYYGNSRKHVHGISENITAISKLSNAEITLRTSMHGEISNSESLIKVLEDVRPNYTTAGRGRGSYLRVKVIDLLRDCVGINRTYSETYNVPEYFHKLIGIEFYSQRNKLVFKAVVDDCNDTIMADLIAKGYDITKINATTYIWTVNAYVKTTPSPTVAERHNLSKKMRDLGLWGYTDGEEYKLYISPIAQKMSSPSIIYHAMFFFGSITRYHPDLFDTIITAKDYWLVSEFLKTQPQQFLYYMVSHINGAEVLFSKQV